MTQPSNTPRLRKDGSPWKPRRPATPEEIAQRSARAARTRALKRGDQMPEPTPEEAPAARPARPTIPLDQSLILDMTGLLRATLRELATHHDAERRQRAGRAAGKYSTALVAAQPRPGMRLPGTYERLLPALNPRDVKRASGVRASLVP